MGFIFAFKQDEDLQPKTHYRTPSELASQLLSRSATTKRTRASDRYANLDINRELLYQDKDKHQDQDIDRKSIWTSIKRKVSMTSLASHTISSASTATKRTKKSSFSSLQPSEEVEVEVEHKAENDQPFEPEKTKNPGVRRAATMSTPRNKRSVTQKRKAVDDTAINNNVKRRDSSLLLGFYDPDHGIAIGRYNVKHNKTLSKTEKKEKKNKIRDSYDYFYEPNTALAIGKLDDLGSFPDSSLKSPLSRYKTIKSNRLSKDSPNNLPICESQPKNSVRRRKVKQNVKTKTDNKSEKTSNMSKQRNKKSIIRDKYKKIKSTHPFKLLIKVAKICTCRCNKT